MQIDKETIILCIIIVASTVVVLFNKISSDDYIKILLFVLGYITKTLINKVGGK